ncbi:hypothetical protein [Halobacteriovorax sp. JY17]|uniref:hypothetical protein n=1 Tax=Halobacteriovorax sp. JY17 TaxID=2014617 RepID=UPI000C45A1E3|nr:hypothetical protein [Halobacteriovorax sp. JY17]PIK15664.1 MAG: hypothetical protein CES88_02755 [Halobacteriovorax sp. JY17]
MKIKNIKYVSLKMGRRALLLISLSSTCLAASADIHFLCENTQVKNGVINSFQKNQLISISSPGHFTEFISQDQSSLYNYKNGIWTWNEGLQSYSIDLKKLKSSLNLKNYSYKLRYLTEDNLTKLEFSPILISPKKAERNFPLISVETIDPRLPIHRTWRLPKNTKGITSANYYIEYNDKYSLLTRIIQSLNSAFLKNTISCKRAEEKIPPVRKFEKVIDLTNSPSKWSESLTPLKESIQQELIDSYLEGSISKNEITKHLNFFEGAHLSKRLIFTKIKLEKISSKDRVEKINELKTILKGKLSSAKNSRVRRIFSKEKRQGLELLSIPIDTSKFADQRDAFKPNKYLDMSIISNVALNKKDGNYFFYFFNNKDNAEFEVGPFKFRDIYWKNFQNKLSSCTEKAMRHLNEYERKSFVFTRSESLPISDELILYERKFKQYPLNEIIITNNCRGPGNIEFEWPGIMKTYFQLPITVMNQIYKDMNDGKGDFFELGVESRTSSFYADIYEDINYSPGIKNKVVSLWSKFFDKDYRWFAVNDFSKATADCSIRNIESDLIKNSLNYQEVPFTYEMGRIEYDQFPVETRMKSGYNKIKTPLVYVKTPCNDQEAKVAPPKHFYPPKPHYDMNSLEYWKKKTCSFTPINFFHYQDLLDYEVHLSMFEVDGIYTGQNWETNLQQTNEHDLALLKNKKVRLKFDFKNAYSFKKLQVARDGELLNIKLSGDRNINLSIGNIDLSKLKDRSNQEVFTSKFRPWATDKVKGIYKLIGINTFDLSSYYVDSPRSEIETFAIFHNDQGSLLNHHLPDIGIEQWFLRLNGDKLILDLISHERITPVARLEAKLPANFLL